MSCCELLFEAFDAEDVFQVFHHDFWGVSWQCVRVSRFSVLDSFGSAYGANFTFEVSHARFARVDCDDLVEDVFRDIDILVLEAVGADLLGDQVADGNVLFSSVV